MVKKWSIHRINSKNQSTNEYHTNLELQAQIELAELETAIAEIKASLNLDVFSIQAENKASKHLQKVFDKYQKARYYANEVSKNAADYTKNQVIRAGENLADSLKEARDAVAKWAPEKLSEFDEAMGPVDNRLKYLPS